MTTSYSSQVEQRVGNLQARDVREPAASSTFIASYVLELTEAQAKMPKKPTFCTRCWTPSLALEAKSCTEEKKACDYAPVEEEKQDIFACLGIKCCCG